MQYVMGNLHHLHPIAYSYILNVFAPSHSLHSSPSSPCLQLLQSRTTTVAVSLITLAPHLTRLPV